VDKLVAAAKQGRWGHRDAKPQRQLAAALKKAEHPVQPITEGEQLAALQRQLKAAQTRIRNLTMDKKRALERAVKNKTALGKRDRRKLFSALHPDTETPPESKKLLTEAFQILNGLDIFGVDED
jgi:hypothetical protein